jgi:hypothetical protein
MSIADHTAANSDARKLAEEKTRPRAEDTTPFGELKALIAKANQLTPDDFRKGQDHLPRAFREIDYRAAFEALVGIFNEIEVVVQRTSSEESNG